MWKIDRPIQRRIACQPEVEIYETRAYKVPITLVRKKKRRQGRRPEHGHQRVQVPLLPVPRRRLRAPARLFGEDRPPGAGRTLPWWPWVGTAAATGPLQRRRDRKRPGHPLPACPASCWPCMQVLEYDRSFLASRILFDRFNGNIISSGAFGLFLKSVVIAAGGLRQHHHGGGHGAGGKAPRCTAGERDDRPYRIRYVSDAVVLVPGARAPGGPVPPGGGGGTSACSRA